MKLRGGPDGLHYFDRRSGLNILFDEINVPQVEWATAPRHVSIALTNTCDLSCSHCYAPKHSTELKCSDVESWLQELDRHGCIGVGFGGGEPTLYKELSRLCKFASEETELAVTFTTHGHHLDKNLAKELQGYVNFIRVSMDGIENTYETIRGRPFSELLDKFEIIRDVSQFGINFLVNDMTYPDLDKAIELASKIGASEFLLIPELSTNNNSNDINKETILRLNEWVSGYKGDIPLAVSEAGRDLLPTCEAFPNELELHAYAHIDASGYLKYSSFDKEGVIIENNDVIHALNKLSTWRNTK